MERNNPPLSFSKNKSLPNQTQYSILCGTNSQSTVKAQKQSNRLPWQSLYSCLINNDSTVCFQHLLGTTIPWSKASKHMTFTVIHGAAHKHWARVLNFTRSHGPLVMVPSQRLHFQWTCYFSPLWSYLIFQTSICEEILHKNLLISHLSHFHNMCLPHGKPYAIKLNFILDSSFLCCAWLCCYTHVHSSCLCFSSILSPPCGCLMFPLSWYAFLREYQ